MLTNRYFKPFLASDFGVLKDKKQKSKWTKRHIYAVYKGIFGFLAFFDGLRKKNKK